MAIVELSDESEFRIWRAEYEGQGQQDAHSGQWVAREVEWTRLNRPGKIDNPVIPFADKVSQAQPSNKLVLIDPLYESELVHQIAADGLYKVGRFETTMQGQVSLSWVNVESLCALNGQMEPIVKRMANWIDSRVMDDEKLSKGEVLLIGLDCWGSILAGQISVKLGIPFLPIATRAEGRYSSAGENMDDFFMRKLTNARAAVLVTDVIGPEESGLGQGKSRRISWRRRKYTKVVCRVDYL